jgi:hypothetical protein
VEWCSLFFFSFSLFFSLQTPAKKNRNSQHDVVGFQNLRERTVVQIGVAVERAVVGAVLHAVLQWIGMAAAEWRQRNSHCVQPSDELKSQSLSISVLGLEWQEKKKKRKKFQ